MNAREIADFKEYTVKMRQEGLSFLDKEFPELTQEEKDIALYNIFKNAERSQAHVLLGVYDIDVDNQDEENENT